jgi:cellobiose phosphorylase
MVAGKDAPTFGEGKNSWLTGTAAWTFTTMSQFILGIKPDFDGLLIEPCIPSNLGEIKITRRFRGKIFNITIDNSAHVESGIKKVIVDGNEYDSNLIKTDSSQSDINVTVVMG